MGITQQIGASSLIKPGVIDNAAARPASPYEGQVIFQKDTDQLLVWNGTAWVIPNSVGTVPNFLTYFTGGNGSAVNNATLAYNAELYDDLNNVSSGVFTVPTGQQGVYSFTVTASCYNIGTSGYFRIDIATSGSSGAYARGSQTPAQGATDTFSTASLIVKLSAGDTVFCKWAVPSSGTYSAGITYNYFSGVRVR
jgi:hypothetical protein